MEEERREEGREKRGSLRASGPPSLYCMCCVHCTAGQGVPRVGLKNDLGFPTGLLNF